MTSDLPLPQTSSNDDSEEVTRNNISSTISNSINHDNSLMNYSMSSCIDEGVEVKLSSSSSAAGNEDVIMAGGGEDRNIHQSLESDTTATTSSSLFSWDGIKPFWDEYKMWVWGSIPLWFGTRLGRWILVWCLNVLGTATGIAVGLGFSTYVYDFFHALHHSAEERANKNYNNSHHTNMSNNMYFKKSRSSEQRAETSVYMELMSSAGYSSQYHPNGVLLRGQILRNIRNNHPNNTNWYPFDGSKGPLTMTQMWPKMSPSINKEWGLLIDLLIRDYVASWYCKIDSALPLATGEDETNVTTNQSNSTSGNLMVLSTAKHRLAPFVEILYQALCHVLGLFSSVAADKVNVATLLFDSILPLIQDQIKTYRELRRLSIQKQWRKTTTTHSNSKLGRKITRSMVSGGVASLPSGKVLKQQLTTTTTVTNDTESQSPSHSQGNQTNNNESSVSNTVNSTEHTSTDRMQQQSHSNTTNNIHTKDATNMTTNMTRENNSTGIDTKQNISSHKDGSSIVTESMNKEPSSSVASSGSKNNGGVSEIGMVREYLLAGKLHQSMTFGLDVPSLLFADPTGKECGTDGQIRDADVVLEERLMSVLKECELDYNRVIAHRLSRALLPRSDFQSTVIKSAIVEMMASCVLTPSLGCITPEFINQWIITKLSTDVTTKTSTDNNNNQASNISNTTPSDTQPPLDTDNNNITNIPSSSNLDRCSNTNTISTLSVDPVTSSSTTSTKISGETQVLAAAIENIPSHSDLRDEDGTSSLLNATANTDDNLIPKSITEDEEDVTTAIDQERLVDEEELEEVVTAPDNKSKNRVGEQILPLLTMSLIEVQAYIDLEDVRLARELCQENNVDWDDVGCRESVKQLVLVVECALLHGMRTTRRPNKSENKNKLSLKSNGEDEALFSEEEDDDVVQDVAHFEPSSLTVVLMEMTSDLDSFEQRIEEEEEEELSFDDLYNNNNEDDNEDEVNVEVLEMEPISAGEISTLRTLIAAWLHTGQLYRTLSVYIRSKRAILYPFYHKNAFLRSESNSMGFLRQLRALDEVDILVDTMAVLASPSLDIFASGQSGFDMLESHASSQYGNVNNDNDKHDDITKPVVEKSNQSGSNSSLSFLPNTGTSAAITTTSGQISPSHTLDVSNTSHLHVSSSSAKAVLRGWNNDDKPPASSNTNNSSNIRRPDHAINALGGRIQASLNNRRKKFTNLVRNNTTQKHNNTNDSPSSSSMLPKTRIPGLSLLNSSNSNSNSNNNSYHEVTNSSHGMMDSSSHATSAHHHSHSANTTPAYLEFHGNEAFAVSLRAERERRMASWQAVCAEERKVADNICRSRGSNEKDRLIHRELHQLARCFYSNTNVLALQYALARTTNAVENNYRQALITMETISTRRRIEVPDDDSSFLLRAQPRALNPIGVHRDPRNHEQSYRCFAATYEEPGDVRYIRRCLLRYFPSDRTANIQAISDTRRLDHRNKKQSPSSTTSQTSTSLQQQQQISLESDKSSIMFLTKEFQQQRNLCKKFHGKGSEIRSSGILASTIMEPNEFNAMPRTGKALDFIYRMTLFEKPMIELAGKKFTVHDSSAVGSHRADASSLEISDAALSVCLYLFQPNSYTQSIQNHPSDSNQDNKNKNNSISTTNPSSSDISPNVTNTTAPATEPDDENKKTSSASSAGAIQLEHRTEGPPMVLMKISDVSKSSDGNNSSNNSTSSNSNRAKSKSVEVRPYRPSFVRAALMVTSARQEAQLKCLIACVKAGSARYATKARTDSILRNTLTLIDFASSNSNNREKQSVLLRDLKLGINHIDRDQLRRNGLLNPRHPTLLRTLSVSLEDTIQEKTTSNNVDLLLGSHQQSVILYKIRCTAVSEYVNPNPNNQTNDDDDDDDNDEDQAQESHSTQEDGTNTATNKNNSKKTNQQRHKPRYGDLFHEEWVVYRQFKDFNILHKHLKAQVNPSESSAGAGAKIVGAATGLATAALSMGGGSNSGTNPNHSNNRGGSNRKSGLVPSLGQATKGTGLGVPSKKTTEKRKQYLNQYLNYMLSPRNLLNQCPELLRFLGAYVSLPPEVKVNAGVLHNYTDALGRSEMKRSFLKPDMLSPSLVRRLNFTSSPSATLVASLNDTKANNSGLLHTRKITPNPFSATTNTTTTIVTDPLQATTNAGLGNSIINSKQISTQQLRKISSAHQIARATVLTRIRKVKFSSVRNVVFDIVRHLFDLDNASFFRSRVISALKTMSFAITSAAEFNQMMLEFHLKFINGKALSEYIKMIREILWPDGVFFTPATPLTEAEKHELEVESLKALNEFFPEQVKTVLGNDITQEGLVILHELLQNRVVLKSITYMIMDTFLLELFPEMSDVLAGSKKR